MWNKGIPKEDGWYLVTIFDEKQNKNRTIRCFWRNQPKKVYYKQNGVTKFRYKGNAGWSENNLQGRKVIAWTPMPKLELPNDVKECAE